MNANAANFDPTRRGEADHTYFDPSQASGGYPVRIPSTKQDYYTYYAPGDVQAYDQSTLAAVSGGYEGGWTTTADQQQDLARSTEPGYYYPISPIHPQTTAGDPVTAIAYDDLYAAIYMATPSRSMSGGKRFNDHRASMLVTHSTTDGMLYSSVAAHPEAPPKVLNSVYDLIYGASSTATSTRIPSHAFRPPFGSTDPAALAVNKNYQMGVNTLVPLQGYVASVSPAAVRLHAHGGLQMADRALEGMLCGTAHPYSSTGDTTHVTVGGGALNSNHQLLCLDLWQELRMVASATLERSTAVTCLATNHVHGSVAAGCSDGHVRLMDGRLRQLAKIKSHVGGVVNVVS
jgi:hypothetical protein